MDKVSELLDDMLMACTMAEWGLDDVHGIPGTRQLIEIRRGVIKEIQKELDLG